ncbi:MAG: tetratricopeptide repeat protein [Candidatus Dojkabacteria bacterium]
MNAKVKNITIDIVIVVFAAALAVGIFVYLQQIQERRDRDNLIPTAKAAYENKEYSKAINIFKEAEVEYPDNEEVKWYLGEIYFAKGKYDESLNYYTALSTNNISAQTRENIGKIYYDKQDYDKVIEYWSPIQTSALHSFYLAEIYYDKGEDEKYFTLLEKIKSFQEPHALLQVKEKDVKLIEKNFKQALSQDKLVDSKETYDVEAAYSLIQEAKKQKEAGKPDFSDLISVAAFTELNQCRFLFVRIDEMYESYKKKGLPIIQLDFYKGKCYNQTDQPDKAMPLLEKAIKENKDSIEYRETLAKTYYLRQDSTNLQKTYDKIIVMEDKDKKYIHYQNLGYYYYTLGDINKALDSYRKSFEHAQTADKKNELAVLILQVELRDKQNLEVCKDEAYSEQDISLDTSENILIVGHCNLYTGKELPDTGQNLESEYLKALQAKDRDKLDTILDQDTGRLITTYFRKVGDSILQMK